MNHIQSVGCPLPLLGIGTHQGGDVEREKVSSSIRDALNAGIRAIDTAVYYGTEAIIGDTLKEVFAEGHITRENLFITAKLPCVSHRRKAVVPALKKSLENLKLDYADMYLIHWPVAFEPGKSDDLGFIPTDESGHAVIDGTALLEDTWKGMEECVEQGLCKYIGVSNFNQTQIERILTSCKIKPANNQIECNPFFNNMELVKFCLDRKLSVTAYSPFRSDFWHEGGPKHIISDNEILKAISKQHNKSPHLIALRFIVQSGCSVVIRSHSPENIKENTEVFEFVLTDEEMTEIREKCETGKRLISFKGLIGKAEEYPFSEDTFSV